MPNPIPPRFDQQFVLDHILDEPFSWLSHSIDSYDGDPEALKSTLSALLFSLPSTLERTKLAVVLVLLGDPQAVSVYLNALSSPESLPHTLAMSQLSGLKWMVKQNRMVTQPGFLSMAQVVSACWPVCMGADKRAISNIIQFFRSKDMFGEATGLLRNLSSHPDNDIASAAILVLGQNCREEHALEELWAELLLEPGIRESSRRGSHFLRELSTSLHFWASNNSEKASIIALQMIREALDADNTGERLDVAPHGWFTPHDLLSMIEVCQPEGVEEVLLRVMERSEIHPQVRAWSMAIYYDLSGKVPVCRVNVADALFGWTGHSTIFAVSKLYKRLLSNRLLNEDDLLKGLLNPERASSCLELLADFPVAKKGVQARIQSLIDGLRVAFESDWQTHIDTIFCLIVDISRQPYSISDANYISGLIQSMIHSIGADDPSSGYYLSELNACLRRFGMVSDVAPGYLKPWERMLSHWHAAGIDWFNAQKMLQEAGAIGEVTDDEIRQVADIFDADDAIEMFFRHGGWRMHSAVIRNPFWEYPHDELLAELVAMPRPPLMLMNIQVEPAPEGAGSDDQEVSFVMDGEACRFKVNTDDGMDVSAVVNVVNGLLAKQGRPERIFRVYELRSGGGEAAYFICGDGVRLGEVCKTLMLPLHYG